MSLLPLSQCHDLVFINAYLEILSSESQKKEIFFFFYFYSIFFDLWSNSESSINGRGEWLLMKLKRNTVHVLNGY